MTRVAAIQSNYIPWKGYFDIINDVDLFIFYDDLQYTKNDWRNRNRIKTAHGVQWLSIPVGKRRGRLICEVQLTDHAWMQKHWTAIRQAYAKSPCFSTYSDFFETFYLGPKIEFLSALNQTLIRMISTELLGIQTDFKDSREYSPVGQKQARLLDLLVKAGATEYVSGPAAKEYIDEAEFQARGIKLTYKDYSGYPCYEQLFPPFEHAVTILDVLFHCGNSTPFYIWGWRPQD